MRLPEDFWLFYVIAGVVGLSWIVSDIDRTGQPILTPLWERILVVALVMTVLGVIHRRIRR